MKEVQRLLPDVEKVLVEQQSKAIKENREAMDAQLIIIKNEIESIVEKKVKDALKNG